MAAPVTQGDGGSAAAAAGGEKCPVVLDRSHFDTSLQLRALRVPAKKCQEYLKKLHGFTFNKPRMRCILHDGDSKDTRLVLLSEELAETGLQGLPPALRGELEEANVEAVPQEVSIGYDYWTADHVLKKLLPEGCEIPGSFETIGHIAHLNIRDELLPYRYIVGQVILDKNPRLQTVVNKVGTITNEYRVFDMEVIAGKPNLETEVRQFNSIFRLNFSEVYWNSRLEAEHKRLVDTFFKPTDTVVDMMAGIGPFAIPAAQKGCQVYANDLNPRSVHYLCINAKRNKVAKNCLSFNMCARKFARTLLRAPDFSSPEAIAALQATSSSPEPTKPCDAAFEPPPGGLLFNHAVMNLPASAVEFLDSFNGAFDPVAWDGQPLPMVHCYTFARSQETDADIQARCEKYLGGKMDAPPQIHNVRNVAPNKNMMCVSFRIPPGVAFAAKQAMEMGREGNSGTGQGAADKRGAEGPGEDGGADGAEDPSERKKARSAE
eukprot:CAMPEP_0117691764 /NCGR_PEP_ID=MMETSP0804-20121206/25925_1 /TAXON_ID=1074897 /ORGANISM="Tetraselmis astigmatica, Strain CCMP880" /LENGTH=489 /DNA_ID=CAMNT_0005505081 /DNA_START=89 /DNA_END=1558 /DNA_ORIENTATION=-